MQRCHALLSQLLGLIGFMAPAVAALYADLAHEVGLINGNASVAGEVLARRITDLLRAAGLPTRLSDCGVSAGIFGVLADEASQQWTGKFNPRPASAYGCTGPNRGASMTLPMSVSTLEDTPGVSPKKSCA